MHYRLTNDKPTSQFENIYLFSDNIMIYVTTYLRQTKDLKFIILSNGNLHYHAIVDSEEVKPGLILDYDANDNVVGLEILGIRKRVPLQMLKSLQLETV